MKDDILFVLTVDPDTQKLQDALEKMGDLLDENVDIAAKEMQKALDAHVDSLEKINKLMDPTAMRERIRMEMELVEARKDLARMEEDERNSGKYKNAAYLDELTRLNKAMNPEGMRERIQMELTLVEKHKALAEAEQRVAMAQRYANGSAQKDLHESLRQQALGMVSSGSQGGQLSALGSTLGSFAGVAVARLKVPVGGRVRVGVALAPGVTKTIGSVVVGSVTGQVDNPSFDRDGWLRWFQLSVIVPAGEFPITVLAEMGADAPVPSPSPQVICDQNLSCK
jgi:hypothetical protein